MIIASELHGLPALVERARSALDAGEPVVLATVVATEGSSYRKAGARMLLHRDGRVTGLLGGGCFEGDLAERAAALFAGGAPQQVRYDMRSDGETLWGLGLGCNGAVDIFLQPLDQAALLARLARLADEGGRLITVVASERDDVAAGSAWADDESLPLPPPEDDGVHSLDGLTVFCDRIEPPPHLLICGAGPDAIPLAAMALVLGWRVSVLDHRPAFADPARFPGARAVSVFTGTIDTRADAAVVMSHHFETDARYLGALAPLDLRYLGVLGPGERRRALLAHLGDAGRGLAERLHGPVGLDLGGELPENIALSILAQVQSALAGRDARPLSTPGG